jgi:hypothetical protein
MPPRYSFPREVTPGMQIVDSQAFIIPKSIRRYKGPLVVMNQEQQEEECILEEQTDPTCNSSNSDSLISATDTIVKDYMPQATEDEPVPSTEVALQTSDTHSSLPCHGPHDSLAERTQRPKLAVTIPTICVNPPVSCHPIPVDEPTAEFPPDISRCNLPLSDSPTIPQTKRHRRQGALFKHPLTLTGAPSRCPLPPVPCINQTSSCPQDRPPLFAPIHKISDHAQ